MDLEGGQKRAEAGDQAASGIRKTSSLVTSPPRDPDKGATPLSLKIKSTSSTSTYTLSTPPTTTINDLKNLVLSKLSLPPSPLNPTYEASYVRLISSGKILSPDSLSIAEFGIKDGCYIHAVVAKGKPKVDPRVPSPSGFDDGK